MSGIIIFRLYTKYYSINIKVLHFNYINCLDLGRDNFNDEIIHPLGTVRLRGTNFCFLSAIEYSLLELNAFMHTASGLHAGNLIQGRSNTMLQRKQKNDCLDQRLL